MAEEEDKQSEQSEGVNGENAESADEGQSETTEEEKAEGVEVNPAELAELDKSDSSGGAKQNQDVNLKMILDVPVDIHIQLGQAQISIGEILKMGSGSLIELDREAGEPADIIVNGKLIGQGEIVVVDDNFGVRVTKLIAPEERIESL